MSTEGSLLGWVGVARGGRMGQMGTESKGKRNVPACLKQLGTFPHPHPLIAKHVPQGRIDAKPLSLSLSPPTSLSRISLWSKTPVPRLRLHPTVKQGVGWRILGESEVQIQSMFGKLK